MQHNPSGKLIYLVGPSGSGKDSLIQYVREELANSPYVQAAHRYITRPMDAGGENHIALTRGEFESRQAAGLFAMCWESHGNLYGIGCEVNHWLCKGISVLINGSRHYLPRAQVKYPELIPVYIDVAPEVLRERLESRGRECADERNARLQRNSGLYSRPAHALVIENDGALEVAGDKLVRIIKQYTGQDNLHELTANN